MVYFVYSDCMSATKIIKLVFIYEDNFIEKHISLCMSWSLFSGVIQELVENPIGFVEVTSCLLLGWPTSMHPIRSFTGD